MTSGASPRRVRSSTTGMVARRSSAATSPSTRLKATGRWPRRSSARATSRTYISDPPRTPRALLVKSTEIGRIVTWLHRFEELLDDRSHVRSVSKDRWIQPVPHACLTDLLVVRDPRPWGRGRVGRHPAQELDAERVPSITLERGLGLGPERLVAGGCIELACECLIVQQEAETFPWGIGVRDEIDFEERG